MNVRLAAPFFPPVNRARSRLCRWRRSLFITTSRFSLLDPASRRASSSLGRPIAAQVKMNAQELQHHLADAPPSVVRLEIEKHFDALTDRQKRYAHFTSRASLAGARIVFRQLSPESEVIYDLIIALHRAGKGDWKALQAQAGVLDEDMDQFLHYSAQFLGNSGNYKSFGDSKFIPRCQPATFAALARVSPETENLYESTKGAIFSSESSALMHLGWPEQGHMTTYYPDSPNITQSEVEAVSRWMEKKGLLPENSRLSKKASCFEILIASADLTIPDQGGDVGDDTEFVISEGPLAGKTIRLIYGDYSHQMRAIEANIRKAAEAADNDTQKQMHLAYAKSFQTGSLKAFKDSQRFWIRDKGPTVETNIGFIETYRDPAGVRGEWEGFAAVQNKERTKAFGALVEAAPELIPQLPWDPQFEKDRFLAPDFTSLEVLTFCGSGLPAGINIPNYDDIRQTEGFKNVSLSNVLSAKAPDEKVPFIADDDLVLFKKYRDAAFEIQVGLHELTGHGCGKLLQETSEGNFNFDIENPPVSPVTGKPITTWYRPGQTWGSVFGSLAASYEECRAELVAMYLGCNFKAMSIFGFGDGSVDMDAEAGDVLYTSYLSMARAGLLALEMWDPRSRRWGQAHSQARFSILQCFLRAPDGFCQLRCGAADAESATDEGLTNLRIVLNRAKILTVGRTAVGEYLQKLHVFKATADVVNGTDFYSRMTDVDPAFWGKKVRDEVLRNKQPRKVFVQANTFLDEDTGKVTLRHYDATLEGMLQSWAERDV